MITIDELKVQLADYAKAVKDLEEALAIEASRKRVQELEHTMSRPGFYDDADLSKKVFDEVGDLKGKLSRFEKLQGLYDDAETMIEMLDEEYDPAMIPEAEEAVNAVGKAVDELQLIHSLAYGVHSLFGFGDHGGVVLLVQHLDHGLGVIVQALQLFKAAQLALQVAHLVKHLFAQVGVIIKAGAGHGVLQLLHTLAGSLDGQSLFQVLDRLGIIGKLHFQFVNGDHSLVPLVPGWIYI